MSTSAEEQDLEKSYRALQSPNATVPTAAVREEASKQYRDAVDRVNRATDAEIAAAVSSSERDAQS